MKNTLQITAITFLTTALMTGCVSTPMADNGSSTSHQPTNQTSTVALALGQTMFLKDQQLNLTFDKVLNDSRCPTGVQCIWAGNATVAVTAMTTTSRPQVLNLSVGDLRGDLRQSQRFANFDIRLDKLSPYPTSANATTSTTSTLPTIQLTIKPAQ